MSVLSSSGGLDPAAVPGRVALGAGGLRRLQDAFADPSIAARQRDASRARELHDAEVVEQLEERRKLLRIARRLDRERSMGGVGDAYAEDLAIFEHARAHVALGADLDEH